jgi:hypothetical protein
MSEELSSQVPFCSTKGDLSDIEDQEEASSEFLFYNVSNQQRFNTNSLFIVSFGCFPRPLFRSATMTTYAPTSSESYVAAQPKSTYSQQAERNFIISNLTNQFQEALSAFSASMGEIS